MPLPYTELWSHISDIVLPLGFDVDDSGVTLNGDPFWERSNEDGSRQTVITLETEDAPSVDVDVYNHEKTFVSTTTFYLPGVEDDDVWAVFEEDFRKELGSMDNS